MKLVISSTVRTFTAGACSYGTLHLRGLYVPKEAEVEVDSATHTTSSCAPPGTAADIPAPASGTTEVIPAELDTNNFLIRCVDTQSIPNELHAFVQFDLPPGCTVLTQSTAAQLTALVLRVLDDLQDLQQDGGNDGLNIVSDNIADFLRNAPADVDASTSTGASSATQATGSNSTESNAAGERSRCAGRQVGVLVYTSRTLPAESRFIRARQQEASLRFRLNSEAEGLCDTSQHYQQQEQQQQQQQGHQGSTPGSSLLNMHSFAITHHDTLCTVSITRAGVGTTLLAGDYLSVQLDFSDAKQVCLAAKIQVSSKEFKPDRHAVGRGGGGQVHRITKVISGAAKSTQDALVVNFSIALPGWSTAGFKGMVLQTPAMAAAAAAAGPDGQATGGNGQKYIDSDGNNGSAANGTRAGSASSSSSSGSGSGSGSRGQAPVPLRYWLEFMFYLPGQTLPFVWSMPLTVHCMKCEDLDAGIEVCAGDETQDIAPFSETHTQQMYVLAD